MYPSMVFSSVEGGWEGSEDPRVGESGPVSGTVCSMGSCNLSNAGFQEARPIAPSM